MKKIKVEDVVDGMVVARLIEDRLGRSILKPGDQLKLTFSSRLAKWGVEEIWIEGDDVGDDASVDSNGVDEKNRESALSKLNLQFEKYDEDSHMLLIKKITQHYLRDPRLRKYLK